jgi:integrase
MTSQLKLEGIPELLANIPPLSAVIRYYDNFSDSYAQVAAPDKSDEWIINFDGRSRTLDFRDFDVHIRRLVKSWCAELLSRHSPVTAESYFFRLRAIPIDRIVGFLNCRPQDVRSLWKQCHSGVLSDAVSPALKNLIDFLCESRIGAWGPEWRDLISQLPLPKVDKYASVRVGNAFLTAAEEASIVRHLDDISNRIGADPSTISDNLLEATALLLCPYQFAFRPKQIAMLEMRNVRIWNDGLDNRPAVHLKFMMIKQHSPKRVFPMVCRVKREWSPLFVELFQRAQQNGLAGADHLFQRTPDECAKVIADTLESLLQRRRTATELRHTAAQRLVDAGASEEELAAFMGHSDLNTGLVYFQSSPTQAERVNRALGISATYQRVVKIAHDRIITPEELADLKGEQQIGGVPHGIPIAGIGGCSKGQPNCPFNPVMSCYGCTRFMPVAEIATHKQVLEDMRGVLKLFYTASRGERGSPAFHLERTISNVKAVIDELGGELHELQP